MKKSFILNGEENNYVLKDSNPSRLDEPFVIDRTTLSFDTAKFYDYVFKGITNEHDIEIQNQIDSQDKTGKIIFETINDISQGVLQELKKIQD